MLDLAILGLLFEQEMHGYEIRRRLRDELGLFANISFGSLYPALSRLERSGAVTVAASGRRTGGARSPRPGRSAASGPACGPGGPAHPRHQAVAQGLPDHRRGPDPLRTAARGGRARGRRRRPELRPAPGLRPAPRTFGPTRPAGAPPGPADPTAGHRPGAAPRASGSTSTPGPSSSTAPKPPSMTSPGWTG